jgi:hypothetical protein
MLKKILGVFSIVLALSFFASLTAFANEEFQIDTKIIYLASTDVSLKVSQEVALMNKLSNVYAQQYSFIIEGEAPTNVYAWDEFGEIKYQLRSNPQSSTISLTFNQEVVGKDKTLRFGLTYYKNDLIKKSGDVWEISIPRFGSAEEVDTLAVSLEVPLSFGPVAFISPEPIEEYQTEGKYVFRFSKNQMFNSGVVAAFGEFQTFDFDLTYHLENKEGVNIRTEIALPPDTSYQKVYYQSISPRPENVEVDGDSNWLAQYKLKPKQRLEVKALGKVKVFAQPFQKFSPPQNLDPYLGPTSQWPIKDPMILQEAKNLKSPQKVYNYVIRKLTYDYSRVREGAERLGAKGALSQPERATCMEFTDLFVALARAVGIPAREVNGYAYTTNPQLRPLGLVQDVLHAWPEYWDEETQTWVQIDPTWQSTTGGVDYFNKLDLGHFTFAIHGIESDYPPPAGAYKIEGEYEKDVRVDFGKFQKFGEEKIEVSFSVPQIISSEAKTAGFLTVHNLSPTALYDLSLGVRTKGVQLDLVNGDKIQILPPFSHHQLTFKLSSLGILKTGPAQITVFANNQEFSHSLSVESIILKGAVFLLGTVLIGSTSFFLVYRIRKRREAIIDSQEEVC